MLDGCHNIQGKQQWLYTGNLALRLFLVCGLEPIVTDDKANALMTGWFVFYL